MQREVAEKQIITGLIASGEEKVRAFREQFHLYRLLGRPEKEKLDLKEKLKEDAKGLLSVIDGLSGWKEKMDVPSRRRAFKVEIHALSLVLRFRCMIERNLAIIKQQAYWSRLNKLCQDFIEATTWFDCKGDEQCQRDLYQLYEFVSPFSLSTDDIKFDLCRFLTVLRDNCDANLIKLLVLRDLLVSVIEKYTNSNQLVVSRTQDHSENRLAFDHVLRAFLAVSAEPMTLLQQIEVAKARVTAYSYQFAFGNVTNNDPQHSYAIITQQIEMPGEWNVNAIYPYIHAAMNFREIKRLATEERRLRQLHLQRAFDFLKGVDINAVFASTEYLVLFSSTLKNGVIHLEMVLGQFIERLREGNRDNKKFSTGEKQFLSNYCQELEKVYQEWLSLLNALFLYSERIAQTILEEGQRKDESKAFIKQLLEPANEVNIALKAVRQAIGIERKDFVRLENRANAMAEELTKMEDAQRARYAKIRENRLAALTAQQPTPLVRPVVTSSEGEEVVEPSLPVKSDALVRLEQLDVRLFEFIRRLVRTSEAIHAESMERLVAAHPPSTKKREWIQRKLNASLSNFQALVRMRARFIRLSRSLTPAEKLECDDGIAASLENFALLLVKAKFLLKGVSELLPAFADPEVPESTIYLAQVESIARELLVDENVSEYKLTVTYPESLQKIWHGINRIPGDQWLFGDAIIDFLRPARGGSGALSVFHFVASCKAAGEVLEVENKFQVSKYNQQQCRLKVSGTQIVNLFFSTEPMFFTCDGVVADSQGNVEERMAGGLQDINDSILRTPADAVRTLKENPEAILIAMLRMSKHFVPDTDLYNALFDWHPEADLNVDHLKAVLAEHLKQLYVDERLEYVAFLNQFDLLKKIFRLDYSAFSAERELRTLEGLVLKPNPAFKLELFKAKPVLLAAQSVSLRDAPVLKF